MLRRRASDLLVSSGGAPDISNRAYLDSIEMGRDTNSRLGHASVERIVRDAV